jgi:hypothetical protein
MIFDKKIFLKRQIKRVLYDIAMLKTIINDEKDFLFKLTNLHEAYKVLMTTLEDNKYRPVDIIEKTEDGLIKYTNKQMEIIFSDKHGVLSVEMGNLSLNKFIFDKLIMLVKSDQKNEIKHILCLYDNYTETNCNICGSFVISYDLSIPIIKQIEGDDIFSFHSCCYNSLC